jgi:hypothetical protein
LFPSYSGPARTATAEHGHGDGVIAEDALLPAPAGRWAIQRHADGRVIGGAVLLPLPPGLEDLELGWQLHP